MLVGPSLIDSQYDVLCYSMTQYWDLHTAYAALYFQRVAGPYCIMLVVLFYNNIVISYCIYCIQVMYIVV